MARFGHKLEAPRARLCPGGMSLSHGTGSPLLGGSAACPCRCCTLAQCSPCVEEPHGPRVTLTQRRRRTNGCCPGGVPRRRFRGRGSGTGPVRGTRGGWGTVLPLCVVPRAAPSPGLCPSPMVSGTAPATRTKPEQIPSNTTTGSQGAMLYTRARNKTKKTPGASILHSTWLLSARPRVQPRLCLHNVHPGTRPAWEWTRPAPKTVLKQPFWVANLPKTFNPHLFSAPHCLYLCFEIPCGRKRVGAQLPTHPAKLWLPTGVPCSPWKKPSLVPGFPFPSHQIKPPEQGKEKSPNDHSS